MEDLNQIKYVIVACYLDVKKDLEKYESIKDYTKGKRDAFLSSLRIIYREEVEEEYRNTYPFEDWMEEEIEKYEERQRRVAQILKEARGEN